MSVHAQFLNGTSRRAETPRSDSRKAEADRRAATQLRKPVGESDNGVQADGAKRRVQTDRTNASLSPTRVRTAEWLELANDLQRAGYKQAGLRESVRSCGTIPILNDGRVGLGATAAGNCQVCGLARCGSRWCPRCWGLVAANRRDDISRVIEWATEQGYAVGMMTLTAAHATEKAKKIAKEKGLLPAQVQSIRELFDLLKSAWRTVNSGKAGKQLSQSRVGYVRACEITVDDLTKKRELSGVHMHYHVLVVSESSADLKKHTELFMARWIKACRSRGLTVSKKGLDLLELGKGGFTVELERDWYKNGKFKGFEVNLERDDRWLGASRKDLAVYLTKGESLSELYQEAPGVEDVAGAAGKELTQAHSKTGRSGGRCSPEQILRYLGTGKYPHLEKQLIAQWRGIEEATIGTRWHTWSRGIRDMAGLGEELSAEEIVGQEHEVEEDKLAVALWDDVKPVYPVIQQVLSDFKRDKAKRRRKPGEVFENICLVLDSFGVEYEVASQTEFSEMIKDTLSKRNQCRDRGVAEREQAARRGVVSAGRSVRKYRTRFLGQAELALDLETVE